MDEQCAFMAEYLLDCLVRDPAPDDFIHGGFESGSAIAAWLKHLVLNPAAASVIVDVARRLAAAYKVSDAKTQNRIETSALEHLLESPSLRPYFASWRDDPVLRVGYQPALGWGLAHTDGSGHAVSDDKTGFLNVDLDLRSTSDLTVLREAWSRRTSTGHVDRVGRQHWLRLNLIRSPKDPADAIVRFGKLVDALPRKIRALWDQASKEFDIGIQAGNEPRSREWILKPDVVLKAARLGAQVRITVYPTSLVATAEGTSPKSLSD